MSKTVLRDVSSMTDNILFNRIAEANDDGSGRYVSGILNSCFLERVYGLDQTVMLSLVRVMSSGQLLRKDEAFRSTLFP